MAEIDQVRINPDMRLQAAAVLEKSPVTIRSGISEAPDVVVMSLALAEQLINLGDRSSFALEGQGDSIRIIMEQNASALRAALQSFLQPIPV